MRKKNINLMIFVKPPADLNSKLYRLHLKLKKDWGDRYKTYIGQHWNSHLRLFGDCFYGTDLPEVLEVIKNNCFLEQKLSFTPAKIEAREDYLILLPTGTQMKELVKVYQRLRASLQGIRSGYLRKQYRQNMETLPPAQKELVMKTGTRYPFVAHISLGKLSQPEKAITALPELQLSNFSGRGFPIDDYFIEISDLDYSHKKLLGPFPLKA